MDRPGSIVDLDTLPAGTTNAGVHHVPEILAPAGGIEQFFAALRTGADAVFLGLQEFNARARAANFTLGELAELVPLAHRHGMKVLVTVNVLIREIELSDLVHTLAGLENIGVDAVIVQDLAVARIVRESFPGLRLHASTQMAIHNLAGVRTAAKLGFRRVVVARELTALELKRIRIGADELGVEIEAFCHGSLCYSYSGLCFFSGVGDGRSGNRGECAYTCREPYKIVSEPGHGFLFSMKDLDTADQLKSFVDAGIHTLKIEGRKKDAQYVASAVRLYREKLDTLAGHSTLREEAQRLVTPEVKALAPDEARDDLVYSFQRAPTSLFLRGRYHENVIDLDNPGHRGEFAGAITAVRGRWIEFSTLLPLERFDGIRVLRPERVHHAKPQHGDDTAGRGSSASRAHDATIAMAKRYEHSECEFSLRNMRGTEHGERETMFSALPGATVAVEVGEDAKDLPRVGDHVFRTRSADLRARTERLAQPPPGERLRPAIEVAVRVDLVDGADAELAVRVTAFWNGHELVHGEATVARQSARSPDALERELAKTFAVFGESGFVGGQVHLNGNSSWFVPPAVLKKIKRELTEALPAVFASLRQEHEKIALSRLTADVSGLEASDTARIRIKIDRIEYLAPIATFLVARVAASGSDARVSFPEIVFEPKRAFVSSADPKVWIDALAAFSSTTGVAVRLAFPTVIRAWDEPLLERWFRSASASGLLSGVEMGNLGVMDLLNRWDISGGKTSDSAEPRRDFLSSDFTAYALNHVAVRELADLGVGRVCLSLEDDLENLRQSLQNWPTNGGALPEVILYKDTPLFIAESCSLTALHNGCPTAKVCGYRDLEIENSRGERFIVAHESCKSIVYGKKAYALSGQRRLLMGLGVADFRVDFLTRRYSDESVAAILSAVADDAKIPETHSANFHGKLL